MFISMGKVDVKTPSQNQQNWCWTLKNRSNLAMVFERRTFQEVGKCRLAGLGARRGEVDDLRTSPGSGPLPGVTILVGFSGPHWRACTGPSNFLLF